MISLLRLPRPAFLSWPAERWRLVAIWATVIGCVTMVLTLCFGLLALKVVGGTWWNWSEGVRMVGRP